MDETLRMAGDSAPESRCEAPDGPSLPPAAARALAEAAERRARAMLDRATPPPELSGRKGPEPVRYGDWERNGLICDF